MNLTTTNFIDSLEFNKKRYNFFSLKKAQDVLEFDISKIPVSYRILLENLIRRIDDINIELEDLKNVINQNTGEEILFSPSRVLMQDYTGVPAVADLAAMRDKLKSQGDDPEKINPFIAKLIDPFKSNEDFETVKQGCCVSLCCVTKRKNVIVNNKCDEKLWFRSDEDHCPDGKCGVSLVSKKQVIENKDAETNTEQEVNTEEQTTKTEMIDKSVNTFQKEDIFEDSVRSYNLDSIQFKNIKVLDTHFFGGSY